MNKSVLYLEFEILVPARFREQGCTAWTEVDISDITAIAMKLQKRFGGTTYSNPVVPPPLIGQWAGLGGVEVDAQYQFFVLVRDTPDTLPKTMAFFRRLKQSLERKYNQQIILITYCPKHVLGEV